MVILLEASSVYLWRVARVHVRPFQTNEIVFIAMCFASAVALSISVLAYGMRTGVKALEDMAQS